MEPSDKSDGPFNAPFRDLDKRLRSRKRADAGKPSPTSPKPAVVSPESTRASSESARASSESARASSESARTSSESARAARGTSGRGTSGRGTSGREISDSDPVSGPADDATIFDRAMSGVKQLDGGRRRRRVPKRVAAAPARGRVDEDREVRAHLEGLASGALPFDITETGEYVEGCVPDFDRRELRRLRAGEMSIRDELDLHRLTIDEARGALDRFILGAVGTQVSCVRIVHGRGLHSKEEGPVLKEKVPGWLSGRRLGRVVLAFTSARPVDGGTGALYVLLRKRPRL